MFNHAVCHGFSPISSTTTTMPIHRASDPMIPRHYRILMIGHNLAKIYGSVLEKQLNTYTEAQGQRALGQAGFQRQHSTIDHIFTLRVVIEEARSRRQKVCACFVNFKKDFDTIPHSRLIKDYKRCTSQRHSSGELWAYLSLSEVEYEPQEGSLIG